MPIRTRFNPLGGVTRSYTLTVNTNPASATCTLTYEGTSYSTKQVTVKAGTIVSYSVYHSTYGTTTGNITVDSDKTLNCNGTYSTSTVTTHYNIPNMSSDGTWGSSNSFAVSASSARSKRAAYQAFDGSKSTNWATGNHATYPAWIGMSFPQSTMITNITAYLSSTSNSTYVTAPTSGSVDFSDDGNNWTIDNAWTNSTSTSGYGIPIPVSSGGFRRYWRLRLTAGTARKTPSGFWIDIGFSELSVTAYTQTNKYTYYWAVNIS